MIGFRKNYNFEYAFFIEKIVNLMFNLYLVSSKGVYFCRKNETWSMWQ